MKLRTTRPLEGTRWMMSGLQAVRRQPLGLAGLVGFMTLNLGLMLTLPWVGALLVAVLLPALTAGWVHTLEASAADKRPTISGLLAPLLSPRRGALLRLGLLYALAGWAVLVLADVIDPSLPDAWDALRSDQTGAGAEEQMANAMQSLQTGMLLRLTMLVPVTLLFWHAPVIIHREGASVAKALFASALASWRNLGAFVVYGVCWALADLALSLLLGGTLGLLGLPQLAMFLAVPVALLFSAAFYASLRASVLGCLDFSAPDDKSEALTDSERQGPDAV